MVQLANQIGFKLLTSTPYYAQANGQVEAANKKVITLIKKKIEDGPKGWYNILDACIWSQLKLLLLCLHLDTLLCYLLKFVFNRPEFRDNMKFMLTIIGI